MEAKSAASPSCAAAGCGRLFPPVALANQRRCSHMAPSGPIRLLKIEIGFCLLPTAFVRGRRPGSAQHDLYTVIDEHHAGAAEGAGAATTRPVDGAAPARRRRAGGRVGMRERCLPSPCTVSVSPSSSSERSPASGSACRLLPTRLLPTRRAEAMGDTPPKLALGWRMLGSGTSAAPPGDRPCRPSPCTENPVASSAVMRMGDMLAP